MSCLIITREIRELAKMFPNETEDSIKNLVSLWQEKNNKSIEDIPLGSELNDFIKELRSPKGKGVGTVFSTSGNNSYPSRTRENANWSDITIALAQDFNTAGEKLTKSAAGNKYVSSILAAESNDASEIVENLYNQIKTKGKTDNLKINIAGNGIYSMKQNQSYYNDLMTQILMKLQDKGVTISEIRSGGQTGIDEAGIIAAQRLGIPNEVHSTANFMFRDKSGKDISDEQAFKNRFSSLTSSRPEEETTEERLSSSFDTPTLSFLEQQQKVDLDFDPRTRRDRVTLISKFFSNEIDESIKELSDSINIRLNNATGDEKIQLEKELNSLDRFSIIKKYTPGGIFNRVKNIFKQYVDDTEENRIQAEFNLINSMKGSEKYSDDQKLEAAKKKVAYKTKAYQKIIDNFEALAEETSNLLIMTEGIVINHNYIAPSDANLNDDTPDGESQVDDQVDDYSNEETYRDGWMTNFRQVSAYESLSQNVRKIIGQVPRLDYNGKYEKDDLGFVRYLDPNYVHATLIDKLRNMVNSDDMIPLMQQLEKNKPWVRQVRKLIQDDEILFSQFYQDFRKDFIPYWIQKRKMMPDGTIKMVTISVNTPEGIYYLLDAWRDNYENGIQLDDDSIYEKNGEINKDNAAKGLKWTEILNNKFINLDTEARLELLESDQIWNTLLKLFHMIGIDVNPAILKTALTDIKNVPGITFTDPIMLLLPQLNIIFNGVKRGDVKSETKENGEEKRGDLINTFGSAYNSIASMIADVTEDAIESSIRENDKSYYSHVVPNYLGKLVKNLKNVMEDKARFEEFIQNEYKQYDWFFKDGRWRNDWLEQLVSSETMRKGFNHKVVLNSDKIPYSNWNDLDYTLVLLTEYWGDPDKSNTDVQWAWYHMPIYSDSPSAEFVRFRKYVSGKTIDEETGEYREYDDIILDKMIDLVNQEYDRIILVNERDREYQAGNPLVEPIANFDIIRKTDGSIKSIGGAEFKFLPLLNDIKYDNGETFIDRLARLSSKESGSELKSFLKNTLKEIIDADFENTYKDWYNIGVLDELPNGKYKNLPFAGQSQQNEKIAKSLAKAKNIIGVSQWTTNMELLLRNYNNNTPVNDKNATLLMNQIKDLINNKVVNGEVKLEDVQSISRNLIVKNNAKSALREYFWNSKLATSQIIQLTTTDLAFYKDIEDFQKRFKQLHSPALRLNTKATFKGERIGRDWEKTIYLKDDVIVSTVLDDIKAILDQKVKNGEMPKMDRDNIINKFRNINVADGQAYRSLSSYKAILGMSGQWTDEMEQAYNNFKNGQWNIADFNIIWQTKKPFLYTQINNDSGVEGKSGIKTPVQHKNSEFLLLAMHELISGPLGKSGKLKAVNEFMETYGMDVVQFESTTKSGKQGVIDLNQVHSQKDVKDLLENITGIKQGTENPNVVHKVSYEDYGIQTATPEHAIDAVQLVGTQIRKLVTSDISSDAIIEVDGKKMTKQEWLDLYNAINTENIVQSFIEINEVFKDPKKIEQILLEELRGNQRYSTDMIKACTLDENGNFNIPLFDPIQSQRVQTLLNSIIKSRITKQKIKGGALIQVSDYGLTDELQMVFKDKDGNLLTWESYSKKNKNATRKDYEEFIKKAREDGGLAIAYLECYMPAYSREFYEPLMDPETHQLDVTKLPDDLRKLIGYRVPTEDKYSMAPLYIKGFLPQQNGSAIMLPAEITTLSGSDFDVDKLYIMLPEFDINSIYNIKGAWDDFYLNNPDIVNEIDKNIGFAFKDYQKKHPEDELDIDDYIEYINEQGVKKYQFSETAQKRFSEWFKTNKKNYLVKRVIKKIKYDFNKSPQDNSLRARNNLLIDMMYGVLTNSDTASKILNPGGFDYQKKAARIVTILTNTYEKDLTKNLSEGGVKFDKMIRKGAKKINAPISSYLFDLPLELSNEEKEERKKKGESFISLTELANKSKKILDPLSPRTQVWFHQQNMTGAKLIGVYANHNANHALIQQTQLKLSDEHGSFILNGKKLTSLHDIMNEEKEYISKNNAGYLAAAVDAAKDPVLADINQNSFTADATMLLSRSGYTPIEIGLLMTQPIIMDIVQNYFRNLKEYKGKDVVIDETINKYKEKAALTNDLTYENYKNNDFYIEDLADNILIAKEVDQITDRSQTSDFRKIEFYQKQVAVGYLFKRIMISGDALGRLVQATKADTSNGAAGPTIADTIIKMQKLDDFIDDYLNNGKFPLENAMIIDNLLEFDEHDDINDLRDTLLHSQLPFLQAFYTLGIKQTGKMLEKQFPHYNTSFKNVIDQLRKITKVGRLNVKTMNSIYNDLFAYIMSNTEFFGTELIPNLQYEEGMPSSSILSSFDKRKDFINKFPEYFNKTIINNQDIADLEFVKRLKVIRANDSNPVDTVIFKNVGQLSPILRERYMRDWETLLYMTNPEAQKFALNLFRYSYYRNGFAFGPHTFIHLAPIAVRNAIPNYIDTLRKIFNSIDDYNQFVDQYIYNHLDNRKLVPEIPETSSVKFTDDDGNIKDEVTFVIDDNSTYIDKKIIKEKIDTPDGVVYNFVKYIARRYKGDFIYYKLVLSGDESIATYRRIEPLGFKNSFIEYEYGKDVEEINTVIDKNKKIYDPYANTNARFDTGDVNIDYDSIPEIPENYWASLNANDAAFKEVYKSSPEAFTTEDNDITNIKPNTDFKDDNDDVICGSQTIYSL